MSDEQEKPVGSQATPSSDVRLRHKVRTIEEERRMLDVLEDDEVREALKELHPHQTRKG